MKKILLAGGAGYIGSVLAEMLLEAGYQVRILDRFFFGYASIAPLIKNTNLETIDEDTRFVDQDAFVGVDIVMDLSGICNDPASELSSELTKDININGSLNLARQAKAAGVSRFIFASSCIVYGFSDEIRTEESAPNPLTLYAESKVITEQKLRDLADDNFCVTFMRNATVYGVSYRMRFDLVVNIMTFSAYTNHKINVFGEGEQWRPLLHVRDVARAFILACDAPQEAIQCEVFNLGGSDENYQIRDLTHLIQEVFPSIEIKNFFSEPDNRSYKVNCDKIQRVLGFKAQISPKEGIIEVKQALEQGKLKYTLQTRTVDVYKQLLEAQLLQAQPSVLSCAVV